MTVRHNLAFQIDICTRCGRTAEDIAEHELECLTEEQWDMVARLRVKLFRGQKALGEDERQISNAEHWRHIAN